MDCNRLITPNESPQSIPVMQIMKSKDRSRSPFSRRASSLYLAGSTVTVRIPLSSISASGTMFFILSTNMY